MTLRTKTLLFLALPFAVFFVGLYLTSHFIVLSSFEERERLDARRNVQRVLSALEEKTTELNSTARDWAAWDETYVFIEDKNSAYLQSNLLPDASYIYNRLSLMVFLDSTGQVVFEKGFDLATEHEAPLPRGLREHISYGSLLLNHPTTESSTAGLLALPEAPLLVSSQPIVTTAREGPIRGTLIWGRSLDVKEIERLAKTTLLSLTLHNLSDSVRGEALKATSVTTSPETSIDVQPLSSDTVAGYTTLRDVYGEPSLILEVVMPREVYALGLKTFRYTLLALTSATLLLAGIMLLVMEKLVLVRVLRLGQEVARIGAIGHAGTRVTITGRDELSKLSDNINRMLWSLEQLHYQVERDRERLKDLAETDGLTGLLNRRSFQEFVDSRLEEYRRLGVKAAMLYLDLDRLKIVNDRFGHSKGDMVLVAAAALLQSQSRADDLVGRVGGDEFAVLLANVTEFGAEQIGRRILPLLGKENFEADSQLIRVTGSIGIAMFPDHGTNWTDLLSRADSAMYQAKQSGGDGLRVWSANSVA
ncbi:MAG: hypothetical protein HW403_721 [Dehalococcoidia bacterium]|nr:hypothetical protein [Dehalococcoidia bacterium]